MWKIFRNTTFGIFIGFALIAAGSLLYTTVYDENLFSYFMNITICPVQNFIGNIWKSANDIIPEMKSAKDMEKEIADLKAEVRELRNVTADYYQIKRQNEQYEHYLNFKKERQDLDFVAASVLGRDPSELFYGFTVNCGTESGISEGDSVITENGFVGCIYKAEENVSKVRTILSPDIKLGAFDSINGDSGVISGNIKLCDEGLTSLTLVSSQNSIKEGDIITSAGLSGMYPKNLLIGKVKSVAYDSYNSSNYAIIEPFENIKNVRDVLIVTGFHGKGEISNEVVHKSLSAANNG